MDWANLSTGDRVKLVLAGAVIIAFVPYFLYVALWPVEVPELDDRGCPAGRSLNEHTIVLIDNTDAYSRAQIEFFQKIMTDLPKQMHLWEMLSVASLRELPAVILFYRCSPEPVDGPFSWSEQWKYRDRSWLVLKADFMT